MKRITWEVWLGLLLIIFSAIVYWLHYAIFRDSHHIFIYMVGDIAFVFIEVLMVTLVIHRLLSEKEKRNRLEKLNVVMGAFMSELGKPLLVRFSDSDPNLSDLKNNLIVTGNWTLDQFLKVEKRLKEYNYEIDIRIIDLPDLRTLLMDKKEFLLRLLENPNLMEHESFTDLIQAVFHLTEELDCRTDLNMCPESDFKHLAVDIKRVYGLLVYRWLDYMRHLKYNYPHLFSLAMRTNPFDETASPVVS